MLSQICDNQKMMTKPKKPATRKPDGLKTLWKKFYEGNPEAIKGLRRAREEAAIARQIYDLRTAAGFTQSQLAKRVGTTQSVIARLEDADYEGHSMAMLERVAEALNRQVEVRFVPIGAGDPDSSRVGL